MIAVNDYIIVRKDRPQRSSCGLILPFDDTDGNNIGGPYTGIVESVGDLVVNVKEHNRILFNDLCQPWVLFDEDDLILIMRESDIIGILEDE